MKKIFLAALFSLSLLNTNAAVLFDRPHDGTGALISSSWFAPDGLDSDTYAYDTFTVTNSGACAEIDWQGGAGSNLKFTISIYDPTQLLGGAAYKTYNVGTNFTQTFIGTFNGSAIYNFKYVPTTSVQLYAGTNYTMMIVDSTGSWPGIARGGGGNHIEFFTGLAMFLSGPGDTAFKIIASDAPTNTITASVTPVGAGMVTGAGDYPSNTVASLVATPNVGWGFSKWTQSGTQVSTAATYNFTVKSNRTLVANFVPAYTVSTAAAPLFGGSITGAGTFNSNVTVTVRATTASGFQFVNWTESGTPVSTATNYSFTLTANHALVANYAPLPTTAVFDFDTGYPALSVYQGMPASQSNRQVTAYFSAPIGSWSIQNLGTSVIAVNPTFTGNMLYPGGSGSVVQIQFSEPLTDFAMDFTTGEIISEYNTAATMRVTAYTNSTATPAVGSGTSQGSWISGGYPEGHLSYHSATPFNIVTVDVAPVGGPSGLFFADNLVVQRFIPQSFTVNASVAPVASGSVTGAGIVTNGATVTLTAIPASGYLFSDWTLGGAPAGTNNPVTFTALSNYTFVANFAVVPIPVAPPQLAFVQTSPGVMILQWPTNVTGFVLEQNSDLASTNWVTYPGITTVMDTNYQATIPTQTGSGYFRLMHP